MPDLNLYLAEMGYATLAHYMDSKGQYNMLSWEKLPPRLQEGWLAAAAAIRRRVVNNGMTAEQVITDSPTPEED